jgi:predicted DNA-binding transcriptional regulator AlpA
MNPTTNNDRFLFFDDARILIGNPPRSTTYDWIKKGHLPKPIQIGPRRVGWLESVLLQWIADRPVAALKPVAKRKVLNNASNRQPSRLKVGT